MTGPFSTKSQGVYSYLLDDAAIFAKTYGPEHAVYAERIVRAMNSFDELVAILTATTWRLDHCGDEHKDFKIIDAALAVLAKAKGDA